MIPTFDTVNGFAARLWNEGQLFGVNSDPRALVAPVVEQALWRRFAQEISGATSAESAVLAAGFAEAWQLEHFHRETIGAAPLNVIAHGNNGELYREARQRFSHALNRQQAISGSELFGALAKSVWITSVIADQHIVRTPSFIRRNAEESFFSTIAACARQPMHSMVCESNAVTSPGDSAVPLRHEFANERDERRAAIRWAGDWLSATAEHAQSSQIAIVVPELHRERGQWERALASSTLEYNLSLGLPVSKHPWAAAGFALVSSLLNALPVETLSAALRHPRWGRSVDVLRAISARERDLLQRGVAHCRIDEFCLAQVASLRAIQDRIEQVSTTVKIGSDRLSRGQWNAIFERLIAAFSGGDFALDSDTFQLKAALLESIERWLQLDEWLPTVTLSEAQRELIEITDQGAFQPEGSDAPIQVVGLLEAAGVPFDAMWLCGSSDRVLPERQRANPFLALSWQRSVRAGLADVDECDARAARLLAAWRSLCPDIRVSLPLERGGEPLQWSPLWRNFPLQTLSLHDRPDSLHPPNLERLDDERAPSWSPGEKESRGTRAFEAQALCPRRGLAEGRWRLTRWPSPESGLSPLQRGELVHAVAQRLGESLMSTANDFDHARSSLSDWIAESISLMRHDLTHVPSVVWTAEARRLQKVFTTLVEIEASREPFRVLDVEKKVESELCGIHLSMRIDRIDEVHSEAARESEERAYAVIDFKSGSVQRGHLFDERLTLPQLPLYAYALGMNSVAAVAFAKVGDEEQGFASLGSESSGFNASARARIKPPEWLVLKTQWTQQLERLATELRTGEASVAPAYGEATCRNCDFDRFCMVDRRALRALAHDLDALNSGEDEASD